jgi:hypothetical protein
VGGREWCNKERKFIAECQYSLTIANNYTVILRRQNGFGTKYWISSENSKQRSWIYLQVDKGDQLVVKIEHGISLGIKSHSTKLWLTQRQPLVNKWKPFIRKTYRQEQ